MFHHIIYLLLLPLLVNSAVKNCPTSSSLCNQPTQIFSEYEKGEIPKSSIFLSSTYLPKYGFDPCTKYGSRNEYISYLTDNRVACVGPWCLNGMFSCSNLGNNCWQVEHIIDKSNSDLSDAGYNVNIYGNIVMAYGKWNQQIGQRVWPIVAEEKSIIYGDIYEQARQNIVSCGLKSSGSISPFMITAILSPRATASSKL